MKVVFAWVVVLAAAAAHAVDITACKQTVPAGQTGTLVADLDCSGLGGTDDNAVRLEPRATLDLNGHTITASNLVVTVVRAADRGSVTIVGPGTITGGPIGVFSERGRGITVGGGVAITGCGVGIRAPFGRVTASDLTVGDNTHDGIAARVVVAQDTTAERNGSRGIVGTKSMLLARVAANDNGSVGLVGDRVRGEDLTLNGNGNEGAFVPDGRFTATRVSATGNGGLGLWARAMKLADSTVVGNGPTGDGPDVAAERRPALLNTTCGTSAMVDSGPFGTWGVCAND